jgi:predicted HAD superfamily Cof-like phosphohydrolase
MNPIDSVRAWVDGVEHHDKTQLYTALVVEEVREMVEAIRLPEISSELVRSVGVFDGLSYSLRHIDGAEFDKVELLDAALDTAWVALCLAYTLTGDKLPAAWAELHRSNVVDKQQDGRFIKDFTGKVKKPANWTPPNFEAFL